MGFLKYLLNKMLGNKDSTSLHTEKHYVPQPTQSATEAPSNGRFEKERNRLADLCKMGDAEAMYEMARLWFSDFSDEERVLIESYESNTSEETLNALRKYMKYNTKFEYYTMWIIRAAVYGQPKAKAIMDRCSYYKDKAYIPYKYYIERKPTEPFWSSNLFYAAGFCDIIRDKEDCGLTFHKDYGYFEFYYVSYYEPADEDGFGSETEYEYEFYDEFFRKIPVCHNASRKEIILGLKKVENERKAFWKKQKNCGNRKYMRSLKNDK